MKASFSRTVQAAYLAPLSVLYLTTNVDGLKFMHHLSTVVASGGSYAMTGLLPAPAPQTHAYGGWNNQFNFQTSSSAVQDNKARSAHLRVLDEAREIANVVGDVEHAMTVAELAEAASAKQAKASEREAAATAADMRSSAEAQLLQSKSLTQQSFLALRGGRRDDDDDAKEKFLRSRAADDAHALKNYVWSSQPQSATTPVRELNSDSGSDAGQTEQHDERSSFDGDGQIEHRSGHLWGWPTYKAENWDAYVDDKSYNVDARQEKEVTTTTCDDAYGYARIECMQEQGRQYVLEFFWN